MRRQAGRWRIAARIVLVVAGIGLLVSTLLPWYSAYSGQALCHRLLEPYADPGLSYAEVAGPCALPDDLLIDLWVFRGRAAIVLGLALILLLLAWLPVGPRTRPVLVMAPIVAFIGVGVVAFGQPGFGDVYADLYYARWGAWIGWSWAFLALLSGLALAFGRQRE